MLAVILTTLSALRLPSEGLLARRAVLINAASAAALIGIGPLAASADEASEFLAGVAKSQEKNLGPSVFEGTYSDPFHPGGTRTKMRATAFPGEDPMTLKTPEDIAPAFLDLASPACVAHGERIDAQG